MPKVTFENTEIAFRRMSDSELRRAHTLFRLIGRPGLVRAGSLLAQVAIGLRIPIGWAIRPHIFAHFCGGETIESCGEAVRSLGRFGIGTILDYSVEGQREEGEFDATRDEVLRTIRSAAGNVHIPFCVFKVTGIARFELLEKVNSKGPLTAHEESEWRRVKDRVEAICGLAQETGTPVLIDAEDSWIQDAIDRLAEEAMERFNREKACVYHTIQLYRHDRLAYLRNLYECSRARGYRLAVKLVRGAYMEKERERSVEQGYSDPIQPDKSSSDRDFDEALRFCVEHLDHISLCSGTHNEKSNHLLMELMRDHGINSGDKRVWFAQLYGMSDHISFNLAHAGYNVAKYVPYGPIRKVIPYLIRRAQENTSVKGQSSRELSLIAREVQRRSARKGKG